MAAACFAHLGGVFMIGLLRVKNEARWIERAVRSISGICHRVLVLDDHSTDRTPEIAHGCGAEVVVSPFEGLDESRDKNLLLRLAYERAKTGEWALMIDGDEELHQDDALMLEAECRRGPGALSMPVLYLWDSPDQVRVDGVYRNFRRASAFRLVPGLAFHSTSHGGHFHCGNVPTHYHHSARPTMARLLHYGYMERGDRLRKYDWYNRMDPNNSGEDGYRHMVVGDLFPADSRFRWGGPLQLEALQCEALAS